MTIEIGNLYKISYSQFNEKQFKESTDHEFMGCPTNIVDVFEGNLYFF